LLIKSRITSLFGSASSSAHLSVRLLAIREYLSGNILNLLFGFGLGQYRTVTGVSSPHMTYLTLLFDRGFIGCSLSLLLFVYAGLRASMAVRKDLEGSRLYYLRAAALSVWVTIIIAFLFYELFSITIMWAVLGWMFALWSSDESSIKIEKSLC
jgi:hypothetical protein